MGPGQGMAVFVYIGSYPGSLKLSAVQICPDVIFLVLLGFCFAVRVRA